MTSKKAIEQILDKIIEILFNISLIASVMIVMLECIGIFSRYLFHFPLNWVPGIIALLADWIVFLGVGIYFYRNQGIVISYFYDHLFSQKARYIISFLISLVIICFTFIGTWQCWKIVLESNYFTTLSIIPIKSYWYAIPFFIGMLSGLLGSLKRLIFREF